MSKCHLYIFNFHHRYVFATQKPQFAYYGTARRRGRSVALRPAGTAAPPSTRTLGGIATARRHSGLISSTPHLLSIRKVSGLSPYSSHGSFGSNATVECSRTRQPCPRPSSRQFGDPWNHGDWREQDACSTPLGFRRERAPYPLCSLGPLSFL